MTTPDETSTPAAMTSAQVWDVMERYGRGDIDAAAAAAQVRPAYDAAVAARTAREADPIDPDDDEASSPMPFTAVAAARSNGTITLAQSAALTEALIA